MAAITSLGASGVADHRGSANVEDLTEKGGNLALLVRGKTRDRIAYWRLDMGRRVKEYLALRGKIECDGAGTPLFFSRKQ